MYVALPGECKLEVVVAGGRLAVKFDVVVIGRAGRVGWLIMTHREEGLIHRSGT